MPPGLRHALAWAVWALLVWGVLRWLGPVLSPFVAAGILAYALQPAVHALVRRGWPRALAVSLVELLALLVLLALALGLVPILARQLPLLREQIPALLIHLQARWGPQWAAWGLPIDLDVAGVRAFLLEHLGDGVNALGAQVLASLRLGGSVALSLLGHAVLLPVVLFYVLLDWPQLLAALRRMIPPRLQTSVLGFAAEVDTLLGGYVQGQLRVMAALALYYSAALAACGLHLALPIGVLTGVAVAVPYLGFGLGLLLALLAALLDLAPQWGVGAALAAVGGVYALGQLIEGFYLTPKLVGERIGLHPLGVIFALLAFGQLLGFVGVLLALPLSALTLVALRRLRAFYWASALYRDQGGD